MQNPLFQVLCSLLNPIARYCLRHGLHIQDLLEAAKVAFLSVSQQELEQAGEVANVSRLAAATGIHRRDVMRISKDGDMREEPQGLVNRLIGQWRHDSQFTAANGKPRALAIDGEKHCFRELVERVSQDLHPGTLLFELERLGAVRRSGNRVVLQASAYVPKNDWKEGYRMLARDCGYLAAAVQENIHSSESIPNLHATTEFDNIRLQDLPQLRQWLLAEGSKFHRRVASHLAKYDLDLNPKSKATQGGGRIVFSSFSLVKETGLVKEKGLVREKGHDV